MLLLMERTFAQSPNSAIARKLVEELQALFVKELENVSRQQGSAQPFARFDWLRDEGVHGGGYRYAAIETPVFNRAAVNVSGVHYDNDPKKRLASADALSTIIHPQNPYAPSVHMHFSWTEMRDGAGYFRLMADLNPAIENPRATFQFQDALKEAAPEHYDSACKQGDRYFKIPALDRHRGVAHFYLEGFSTGDFGKDAALTRRVGTAAITTYIDILRTSLKNNPTSDTAAKEKQLAYHTAYLFQVLTLDRGTTSGLLVHQQNDLGIMGSLPSYVDPLLLASWASKVPSPQDSLVLELAGALGQSSPCHVTDEKRIALAQIVRSHYQNNPEALDLQAKGNLVPPTVANHS